MQNELTATEIKIDTSLINVINNKKEDLIRASHLYRIFNKSHSELLFQVIFERTESGSFTVTKNLEFSKCKELIQETMLTNSLIDRVTSNIHILNMNAEFNRLINSCT